MVEEVTLPELSAESKARIDRMFFGCQEVIGVEHLESVFRGAASHSGDDQLSAYIGLEPSGKAHLGWIILGDTIRNLLDEGVNVIILLADWHAWVNDKFGRDMGKISTAAEYIWRILERGPDQVKSNLFAHLILWTPGSTGSGS